MNKIVKEPRKKYVCVNDERFGCGTVVKVDLTDDYIHTGEPNSTRKFSIFCDTELLIVAKPSFVEVPDDV